MQTIQQNIKELNTTMSYLNQRITKTEKQVRIKIPIQTNVSSNNENSGNKNKNNTYYNTKKYIDEVDHELFYIGSHFG